MSILNLIGKILKILQILLHDFHKLKLMSVINKFQEHNKQIYEYFFGDISN